MREHNIISWVNKQTNKHKNCAFLGKVLYLSKSQIRIANCINDRYYRFTIYADQSIGKRSYTRLYIIAYRYTYIHVIYNILWRASEPVAVAVATAILRVRNSNNNDFSAPYSCYTDRGELYIKQLYILK